MKKGNKCNSVIIQDSWELTRFIKPGRSDKEVKEVRWMQNNQYDNNRGKQTM